MAISFDPRRGTILMCDFNMARISPEMEKRRQAIVFSIDELNTRHGLLPGHCTVLPTTGTAPEAPTPDEVPIPFGKYWSFNKDVWVCAKMITLVSHTRLGLLIRNGKIHPGEFIDRADMQRIETAVKWVFKLS